MQVASEHEQQSVWQKGTMSSVAARLGYSVGPLLTDWNWTHRFVGHPFIGSRAEAIAAAAMALLLASVGLMRLKLTAAGSRSAVLQPG